MPATDVVKGLAIVAAAVLISSNLNARASRWQAGQPSVLPPPPATPVATHPVRYDPWHDTALGIFR